MTDDDLGAGDVAALLSVSMDLLVRRGHQLAAAAVAQAEAEEGITPRERSVLSRLDRGGPASPGALARAERVRPQGMGLTLGALESRGLVERRPDPEDGRRVIMSLTDAGRRVLAIKRTVQTEALAQTLSDEFTRSELRQLATAARLIERLAYKL